MKRFDKHVFVCENRREAGHPRGCCAEKGAAEIREELKKRVKEAGLNASVRVNSAGCLDACEFGPVIVVYPEAVWYGNVQLTDISEIIESHLRKNIPVDRLMIKDKRFNRDKE